MRRPNLKACPHCRRKVRLSQKSPNSRLSPLSRRFNATVALFCDSRRFRRQIVAEIGDSAFAEV